MPILALQEDEEAPSESEDSEQRLQEQNQKKQDDPVDESDPVRSVAILQPEKMLL